MVGKYSHNYELLVKKYKYIVMTNYYFMLLERKNLSKISLQNISLNYYPLSFKNCVSYILIAMKIPEVLIALDCF